MAYTIYSILNIFIYNYLHIRFRRICRFTVIEFRSHSNVTLYGASAVLSLAGGASGSGSEEAAADASITAGGK